MATRMIKKVADMVPPEKKDKRCQYLPPIDEDFKMIDFRDQILVDPISL
jgi:hypothetical protein